ncbi:hypothetical protein [Leisingera sp. ANG-S3]|uniref:hypothetical protein n=1 Tax=Leisingera sp. ANG-S3 TaxID=1577899 RepID=UPI00126A4FE4|nr:hypothetical protein [Leisingera sp. ANG-S3]
MTRTAAAMKWTFGRCLFEVSFAAVSCFAVRFGAARGIGWFSTEKQNPWVMCKIIIFCIYETEPF